MDCGDGRARSRIIPAYAGQMGEPMEKLVLKQDHPRIRGTNTASAIGFAVRSGSSPHTRDKFVAMQYENSIVRIIPAYAGQMIYLFPSTFTGQDHPRIRGTNIKSLPLHLGQVGSSPHTRDKFVSKESSVLRYRIIPAYAGQIRL